MRTYHQLCPIARALDSIGDRWSLLIVRELLLRDCRFNELMDGLPGIATNLLAERLKALGADGLVERDSQQPGSVRYRLTQRGRDLAPVIRAVALWGAPSLLADTSGEERGRWAAIAADLLFSPVTTEQLTPFVAHLHCAEDVIQLKVPAAGSPLDITIVTDDPAEPATVQVTGRLAQMYRFLLGLDAGVQIHGDARPLQALVDLAQQVRPVI